MKQSYVFLGLIAYHEGVLGLLESSHSSGTFQSVYQASHLLAPDPFVHLVCVDRDAP